MSSFVVGRPDSGKTLAAVVRARLKLDWTQVRQMIRREEVRLDGRPCRKPAQVVQRGQRISISPKGTGPAKPPPKKRPRPEPRDESVPRPVIRYTDRDVVVVDKPPGLTTVRHAHEREEFGRRARKYLPPTLADLLPGMLAKGRPGPRPRVRAVHRLDRETSGLLVFARTEEAEGHLGRQLRKHTVERKYLALVRGRAKSETIESSLVDDRGDGRRGSTATPGEGKHAVTHVRVVEELGEFTLVECRLETGRTHQVRIHLGERGTPLCGERVYDRPPHGQPLPDASGATRPLLHAAYLAVDHPSTDKRMHWTAPPPEDMREILEVLRKRKGRPPAP